jgi:Amt family ammonium transporter
MSLRSIQALTVTNIAAAMGGLTWMALDWRIERKWSTIGICSGIIAGLVSWYATSPGFLTRHLQVGITPAAGYVGCPSALAIGIVTAACCNFATKVKFLVQIDDSRTLSAHITGSSDLSRSGCVGAPRSRRHGRRLPDWHLCRLRVSGTSIRFRSALRVPM